LTGETARDYRNFETSGYEVKQTIIYCNNVAMFSQKNREGSNVLSI